MGRYEQKYGSVTLKKVTRRGPGRPKKVKLVPEDPKLQQLKKNKDNFLKNNKLLNKIADNPNSLDVLDLVMFELAEEAVSLEFDREQAESKGKPTSTLSSKKVTALKSVADVYFRKRDAIVDNAFDFDSDRFEKFIEWMFELFKDAATNSKLTTEQISLLFDNVSKRFEDDDWQEDALKHIKS